MEALPRGLQNYQINEKIRNIFDWVRDQVVIRKHDNSANFGLRMTPTQTLEDGGLCSDYARVYITLATIAELDCTRLYLYRNSDLLDKHINPSFHVIPIVQNKSGSWICPDVFAGELYIFRSGRIVYPDTLLESSVWQDIPPGRYLDSYGSKFNWVKIPVIFPAAHRILSEYHPEWIESARMPYFTERPNLFGALLLFLYTACSLVLYVLYRFIFHNSFADRVRRRTLEEAQ